MPGNGTARVTHWSVDTTRSEIDERIYAGPFSVHPTGDGRGTVIGQVLPLWDGMTSRNGTTCNQTFGPDLEAVHYRFDVLPSPAIDALRTDFNVALVVKGWTGGLPARTGSVDTSTSASGTPAIRIDLQRRDTSTAPLPSTVELSVRQQIELSCW